MPGDPAFVIPLEECLEIDPHFVPPHNFDPSTHQFLLVDGCILLAPIRIDQSSIFLVSISTKIGKGWTVDDYFADDLRTGYRAVLAE